MKLQFFLRLTVLTACYGVNVAYGAVCWDTGCQPDSWAVRGCQQYGMVDAGQKPCADGIIYSCCEPNRAAAPPQPKCWDTGCQLDSWAVRGCQQYGMVEVAQKFCQNGIVYSCCESNSVGDDVGNRPKKPKCWDTGCQLNAWAVRGCEQYDMAETGRKPCPDGIVYSCCETNSTATPTTSPPTKPVQGVQIVTPTAQLSNGPSKKPKCWDTGCQSDSWAVRGCAQYDMLEVSYKACPGGIVYSCCHANGTGTAATGSAKPKCWDTGCQLDAWAVRGCEQYDMVEVGRKPCPNGVTYSCCQRNGTNAQPATISAKSKPKCWDTGCQHNSWAVRGCDQYDMVEVGQKSCPDGTIYSCCDKNDTVSKSTLTSISKPKCWDTDCQLDSWTVRGCEQYDMVEVGRKPCPNGMTYSCCQKNDTSSESTTVAIQKPKCWDTGCQLDGWAVRGCEQYDMVEVGRKPCPNGITYSCCQNNDTSSESATVATQSKPKCWDTGCQHNSWAVRGCDQYDMVEVGQKSCPDGTIYSCCHENGTTSTLPAIPAKNQLKKCWDTGCQLDSWAVRGCQQYGMVETGQKSCPDGILYSCCEQNGTLSTTKKTKPKCWDTGCQLESWAVRGCEQYDMVELAQKPCEDGIVYSCCHKNETVPAPSNGYKKCWETGCQQDVWETRGCEQYGMIEQSQSQCTGGIVFTCCRP